MDVALYISDPRAHSRHSVSRVMTPGLCECLHWMIQFQDLECSSVVRDPNTLDRNHYSMSFMEALDIKIMFTAKRRHSLTRSMKKSHGSVSPQPYKFNDRIYERARLEPKGELGRLVFEGRQVAQSIYQSILDQDIDSFEDLYLQYMGLIKVKSLVKVIRKLIVSDIRDRFLDYVDSCNELGLEYTALRSAIKAEQYMMLKDSFV